MKARFLTTVRRSGRLQVFATLMALLPSCVVYEHSAVSKSGNTETDKLYSLGGTTSQRGADGSSLVHDHQQSFRDGTVVATSGFAAWANVKNTASLNNLNGVKAKANTTPVITTEKAASGATVQTITYPPQQ